MNAGVVRTLESSAMSFRSVSVGLAAAVALSACGGAAAPSVLVSQAQTQSGQPTAAPTTATNAGDTKIAIIDDAFEQTEVTVSLGTTVTWTNQGQREHTVSATDGGFGSDGTLKSGESYAHTFDTAGTFAYFCAIHTFMKASITVTP